MKKLLTSLFIILTITVLVVPNTFDTHISVISHLGSESKSGDSWTTKAPMPTARAGMGAAVINDKIYVIGGENRSADPLAINARARACLLFGDIPLWPSSDEKYGSVFALAVDFVEFLLFFFAAS